MRFAGADETRARCEGAPARSQAGTGGLAGIFTEFRNSLAESERPLPASDCSFGGFLAELLGLRAGFERAFADFEGDFADFDGAFADFEAAFVDGLLVAFELLFAGFDAAGLLVAFEELDAALGETFADPDEALAVEGPLAGFEAFCDMG